MIFPAGEMFACGNSPSTASKCLLNAAHLAVELANYEIGKLPSQIYPNPKIPNIFPIFLTLLKVFLQIQTILVLGGFTFLL